MKMAIEDREMAWWIAGRQVLARELYRASLVLPAGRLTPQHLRELLDGLAPGWKRRSDLGGLPEPGP